MIQGKEVATDVRLLPQGTVIFEDISIEHFEGTVTKVIPKVPSKNQVNVIFLESRLCLISNRNVTPFNECNYMVVEQ